MLAQELVPVLESVSGSLLVPVLELESEPWLALDWRPEQQLKNPDPDAQTRLK